MTNRSSEISRSTLGSEARPFLPDRSLAKQILEVPRRSGGSGTSFPLRQPKRVRTRPPTLCATGPANQIRAKSASTHLRAVAIAPPACCPSRNVDSTRSGKWLSVVQGRRRASVDARSHMAQIARSCANTGGSERSTSAPKAEPRAFGGIDGDARPDIYILADRRQRRPILGETGRFLNSAHLNVAGSAT